MPIQRIAFKDWLPDQPSILDAVSKANNVIPLAVGYGYFTSKPKRVYSMDDTNLVTQDS